GGAPEVQRVHPGGVLDSEIAVLGGEDVGVVARAAEQVDRAPGDGLAAHADPVVAGPGIDDQALQARPADAEAGVDLGLGVVDSYGVVRAAEEEHQRVAFARASLEGDTAGQREESG